MPKSFKGPDGKIHEMHVVDNIENGEADLLIYDEIGNYGVSAVYIVSDIKFLVDYYNVNKINIRINSPGGTVSDGLAIVSEIISSKAEINTIIDGLAASSAGFIAMAGKSVKMRDFGLLMLHEPHFGGQGATTPEEQEILDKFKASIVTVFSKRRGMDPEQVSEIMKKESWFDASEAMDQGFVDEIIETEGGAPTKTDTKDLSKLYNVFNSFNTDIAMKKEVLDLCKKLGIETKDKSEAEILTAIHNRISTAENRASEVEATLAGMDVDNLNTQISDLKAKNSELKNKLKTQEEEAVQKLVENAIKDGRLKKGCEDTFKGLSMEQASKIIENISVSIPSIKNSLNGSQQTNGESRETWSIMDWQKKDPEGLASMMKNEPENYKRLYKEYYKKEVEL